MRTKNELIEKYAERGIIECNKFLNDPNQKINHDYWLGKRIVFNSILTILDIHRKDQIKNN